MSGQGYIYIPNWDGPKGFQHYGNRRPSWIKNYLELLDNDAYLDLSLADRGVLHAIWMLVARVGQGRCIYSASYLQKQCNSPAGHMRRSLERLNHAGFIEVRASRALAPVYQPATPEVEEERDKPLTPFGVEKIDTQNRGSRNTGKARRREETELQVCRSLAAACLEDDPPHLAAITLREVHPDLADRVIASWPGGWPETPKTAIAQHQPSGSNGAEGHTDAQSELEPAAFDDDDDLPF